jgi:hypothetical protein
MRIAGERLLMSHQMSTLKLRNYRKFYRRLCIAHGAIKRNKAAQVASPQPAPKQTAPGQLQLTAHGNSSLQQRLQATCCNRTVSRRKRYSSFRHRLETLAVLVEWITEHGLEIEVVTFGSANQDGDIQYQIFQEDGIIIVHFDEVIMLIKYLGVLPFGVILLDCSMLIYQCRRLHRMLQVGIRNRQIPFSIIRRLLSSKHEGRVALRKAIIFMEIPCLFQLNCFPLLCLNP